MSLLPLKSCPVLLLALSLLFSLGCNRSPFAAPPPPPPTDPVPPGSPPMEKFVTDQASFVLYLPKGWKATEQTSQASRTLLVSDPTGAAAGRLSHGVIPPTPTSSPSPPPSSISTPPGPPTSSSPKPCSPRQVPSHVRRFLSLLGIPKEFRAWASVKGSDFTCMLIEAPAGKLAAMKELLLTTMSNARPLKGAFVVNLPKTDVLPLSQHQLPDGSARFKLPKDWKYQALAPASFIAGDPNAECSFSVASVPILSPLAGVFLPASPSCSIRTPTPPSRRSSPLRASPPR